jgi:hypothetical protein
MSTHTPGPWLRDGRTVYALNNQRVPINRMSFGVIGGYTDKAGERTSEEELEKVAILAKAAPKLLGACKLALKSWFSGEICEISMEMVLREAIAEAEGKT